MSPEELNKHLESIPDKPEQQLPVFVEVNPLEKVAQSSSFFPLGAENPIFQGVFIGTQELPDKQGQKQYANKFETANGDVWLIGQLYELEKALDTVVENPDGEAVEVRHSKATLQIKWLGAEKDESGKNAFVKLAIHIIKW